MESIRTKHILRLHQEEKQSDILGPQGFFRYIIWMQGCLRQCKGCISPLSRPLDGGYEKSVSDLANDIRDVNNIEGITISGGEPFLQAEALAELIAITRKQKNLGITIYTGNTYEQLIEKSKTDKGVEMLLYSIDVLVDGEYIESLNDNGALRGSSNQRAIRLTDRYSKELIEKSYGIQSPRRAIIRMLPNGLSITGVPDSEQYKAFNSIYKIGEKKYESRK